MLKTTKLGIIFLITALLAGAALAQNEGAKEKVDAADSAAEQKYFRLDFTLKELESGKTVNSRAYSTTILTGKSSRIRTGNKVPVPTLPNQGKPNFTYVDVGVNIHCQAAREVGNRLALSVSADISSAAVDENKNPNDYNPPPLIRQNGWNGDVIVPLRKQTVIFSSDDPSTKRQVQLELTATPLI